ncbi:MAG: hypothetical protein ACI9K1_001302 [Arcticibacterium sp.]
MTYNQFDEYFESIDKLPLLYNGSVDVLKALEVIVALNTFDSINEQLESIEGRAAGI